MMVRISTGWMVASAWALFCGLAIWLTVRGGGISLDTDSAMRLSEIRDLLNGQNWFDTSQHRMDAPYGLSMHWSRLADLGPAALILALRGVIGAGAETATLYVWPLLLLLPVMRALARIAEHLGGRSAALLVLILTLLCTQTYGLFAPGNIDHHALQIALALWTLIFLIEQSPTGAALCVAASLCIGLETLPYAIVTILLACLWLTDPGDRARRFGLSLAAMALLLLFALTATAYRFTPVCDTYSEFYAVLLAAGGAGLALVAMRPRGKLLWFALLTLGVAGLAYGMNRTCFGGPFVGISANLRAIFLSRINEARPAWDFMHFAPSEFVSGYCYAVFALIAGLFLSHTGAMVRTLLFAAAALTIATFEIRAVPFAILFALPGLAAAMATYLLPRGVVLTALALLVASDGAFALEGVQIEGVQQHLARIQRYQAQAACGEQAAMGPLISLPTGRVAGFVDQGPAILAYTQDSAIAGPYHRDADGIEDTYAIFTGMPEQARAILQRRGISYVMACSAAPDWSYYIAKAPNGLLARLARHQPPGWLMLARQAGAIQVWRVVPAAGSLAPNP
jgi:hypothetical protein